MAFDRPQVFPPSVSNPSRVYLVGLGQVRGARLLVAFALATVVVVVVACVLAGPLGGLHTYSKNAITSYSNRVNNGDVRQVVAAMLLKYAKKTPVYFDADSRKASSRHHPSMG